MEATMPAQYVAVLTAVPAGSESDNCKMQIAKCKLAICILQFAFCNFLLGQLATDQTPAPPPRPANTPPTAAAAGVDSPDSFIDLVTAQHVVDASNTTADLPP